MGNRMFICEICYVFISILNSVSRVICFAITVLIVCCICWIFHACIGGVCEWTGSSTTFHVDIVYRHLERSKMTLMSELMLMKLVKFVIQLSIILANTLTRRLAMTCFRVKTLHSLLGIGLFSCCVVEKVLTLTFDLGIFEATVNSGLGN